MEEKDRFKKSQEAEKKRYRFEMKYSKQLEEARAGSQAAVKELGLLGSLNQARIAKASNLATKLPIPSVSKKNDLKSPLTLTLARHTFLAELRNCSSRMAMLEGGARWTLLRVLCH